VITNIRHTGIVTNDLDVSLHFYRDLLGFRIVRQMDEAGVCLDNILATDGVKVTTVKMEVFDGQMVELLHYTSHHSRQVQPEVSNVGLSHIAFTVKDLNAVYESLQREGVEFNCPPQLSSDGAVRVTFCRAPEGTFIELVEVIS